MVNSRVEMKPNTFVDGKMACCRNGYKNEAKGKFHHCDNEIKLVKQPFGIIPV